MTPLDHLDDIWRKLTRDERFEYYALIGRKGEQEFIDEMIKKYGNDDGNKNLS